jgi:hypothetical protein
MFLRATGKEFHATGPATANELSVKQVLVLGIMKFPCEEDHRQLSLRRLHSSCK